MKRRLESELISIAHRILKLKNKSEVIQLQQETLRLYENLSVLRFVEENYQDSIVEIPSDIQEKLEHISESETKKITQTKEISEIISSENNSKTEDLFSEKDSSKKENPNYIDDSQTETSNISEIISTENLGETQDNKINFEDFEAQLSNAKPKKTAVFFEEKIITPEEESISTTETEFYGTKEFEKINQPTQRDFDIRLNDRVAFEFHLFNGETENFQRVISQLSTFDAFEQAKDFIENVVKPDYNNWLMKEEYENRFIKIIENRFM